MVKEAIAFAGVLQGQDVIENSALQEEAQVAEEGSLGHIPVVMGLME